MEAAASVANFWGVGVILKVGSETYQTEESGIASGIPRRKHGAWRLSMLTLATAQLTPMLFLTTKQLCSMIKTLCLVTIGRSPRSCPQTF
jgi:hypothetical protein